MYYFKHKYEWHSNNDKITKNDSQDEKELFLKQLKHKE